MRRIRDFIADTERLFQKERHLSQREAELLTRLRRLLTAGGAPEEVLVPPGGLDDRLRAVEARREALDEWESALQHLEARHAPPPPSVDAEALAQQLRARLEAEVEGLSRERLERLLGEALGRPLPEPEATRYAYDEVSEITSGVSQEAELLTALFAEEEEVSTNDYSYQELDLIALEAIPDQIASLLGSAHDEETPDLARLLMEAPPVFEIPESDPKRINTGELPTDLLELARNAPGEADEALNALLQDEPVLEAQQLELIGDTSHLLESIERPASDQAKPAEEGDELVEWIRDEIQKQRILYQSKDRGAEEVMPDEYVKLVTDLSGMLGFVEGSLLAEGDPSDSLEAFFQGGALDDLEGALEAELEASEEPPSPPSPVLQDERAQEEIEVPESLLEFLDTAERLQTQNALRRSPIRALPDEVEELIAEIDEEPGAAPDLPDDLVELLEGAASPPSSAHKAQRGADSSEVLSRADGVGFDQVSEPLEPETASEVSSANVPSDLADLLANAVDERPPEPEPVPVESAEIPTDLSDLLANAADERLSELEPTPEASEGIPADLTDFLANVVDDSPPAPQPKPEVSADISDDLAELMANAVDDSPPEPQPKPEVSADIPDDLAELLASAVDDSPPEPQPKPEVSADIPDDLAELLANAVDDSPPSPKAAPDVPADLPADLADLLANAVDDEPPPPPKAAPDVPADLPADLADLLANAVDDEPPPPPKAAPDVPAALPADLADLLANAVDDEPPPPAPVAEPEEAEDEDLSAYEDLAADLGDLMGFGEGDGDAFAFSDDLLEMLDGDEEETPPKKKA